MRLKGSVQPCWLKCFSCVMVYHGWQKSIGISSTYYLQNSNNSHTELFTSDISHILSYLMHTPHHCILITNCIRNSVLDSISQSPLLRMGFPGTPLFPSDETHCKFVHDSLLLMFNFHLHLSQLRDWHMEIIQHLLPTG